MKRVLMVFAAALLICGLAFAANEQNTTGAATTDSSLLKCTGTIDKIDPETRTITLRDYSTSDSASNSGEMTPEATTGSTGTPTVAPNEQTGSAGTTNNDAKKSDTKVLKYNEHTNFASSNPESVDGRMSDLKVGDVVMIQFDDQNTIVRIEEVPKAPSN